MAVTVRLQRHGTKNRPFYHVVATDSRSARNGKFIEKLGYYDPGHEPSVMEVKEDRLQYWYSKGATLSDTVKAIVKGKKLSLSRKAK